MTPYSSNYTVKYSSYTYLIISSETFQVGDKMLMKDHKRKKRKGGKMGYKWLGPYSIKQILGNGLYSVKDLCTKQVIQRVNGCHLKPYLSRSIEV